MLNTNNGPPIPRIRDRSGPAPANRGAPITEFPKMRSGVIRDNKQSGFSAGTGEECPAIRANAQVKMYLNKRMQRKPKGSKRRLCVLRG